MFEKIRDVDGLESYLENIKNVGFQATNLGRAKEIFEEVLKEREKTTIFLSFTANMIASGVRGIIREMIKRKLADVIVTTPGALEHDVIKSFYDYELGDFEMDDSELRRMGKNRIGNILVDNKYYEFLEKINFEIFDRFNKKEISPSELANAYGEFLNQKEKEDSFLYWCYKNKIPVFSPGILDGAIGLHLYFFRKLRKDNRDFSINPSLDMDKLASIVLNAEKTAGIILGGGISKHHVLGVNLVRGGLDYSIYFTTSPEYDGSLSGAKPKEGVSWGKIKEKRKSVVVYGEITLTLPLFYKIISS